MNKNLQYTLMSFTGILLMVIASGAFDSNNDDYYEDTESAGLYEIGEPIEQQAEEVDAQEDIEVAVNTATDEQYIEWVDQLAIVDAQYPNDMERLEKYQSLLDDNKNPFAPILLASTIVNVKNQSRDVDIFEEWLASFGFDVSSIDSLETLANNQNVNAMFLLGVYYYQVQLYDQSRSCLSKLQTKSMQGQ